MSYHISVRPGGFEFESGPDENLVEAALRQGVNLPHGCRSGACGACIGKVLQGELDRSVSENNLLTSEELNDGKALFCCARARSDLVIESVQARKGDEIVARNFPARIEHIERPAPDVLILTLKLPGNENFLFHAGQYVDILLKNGAKRSYSIANPPHDNATIELHVRHMPGGLFTERAFNNLKEREILRLNGPHGSFFLRDSDKPIMLVAGSTGMAPIKSIIEHLIHFDNQRPVALYWGCRAKADLYIHEQAEQWASTYDWLGYTPVLSEPLPSDHWTGRDGLVHRAVMADLPDLSKHQVYACGSPAMVLAARQDFTRQSGLPEAEFYSDAFTSSAPLTPSAK